MAIAAGERVVSFLRSFLAITCAVCGLTAQATAEDNPGSWLRPIFGKRQPQATYQSRGWFGTNVRNQPTRLNMVEQQLDLTVPLMQNQDREWSLSARLGHADIHSRARLLDAGQMLPSDLWDIGLSTTYRFKAGDKSIAGFNLGLNSPSDKPFDSIHEVDVQGNVFYRLPTGDRDAWVFMVNYASNRSFARNVPLPGVAYEWNPTSNMNAMLGVPFSSVRWHPFDRLTLNARYLLPRHLHAKASYDIGSEWTLFGAFDWTSRRWFRHDRTNKDDSLEY